MATEFKHIEVRTGTAGEWASVNPVLYLGEIGFESNTRRIKIGDGVTAWNSLPYAAEQDLSGLVLKAGDTMTGNLTIERNAAVAALNISSDAGQLAELALLTDNEHRWVIRKSNDAEVGGNDGSHLDVLRFDDNGVVNGLAFRIYRQSGVGDFPFGVNTSGTPAPGSDNIQIPNTFWVNDNICGHPVSNDRVLLATTADTYYSVKAVEAGEWVQGTHYRIRVGLSKIATASNLTLTVRYGPTGTVGGDTALLTFSYAGSTAASDVAVWEFDIHVDSINAATGQVTVLGNGRRNNTTTGFANTDTHPVVTAQTGSLNTTAAGVIGLSLACSTANVITMLFANVEKIART